jgi:hypothetical protein
MCSPKFASILGMHPVVIASLATICKNRGRGWAPKTIRGLSVVGIFVSVCLLWVLLLKVIVQ